MTMPITTTVDQLFLSLLAHQDYQEEHDRLHLAFASKCGEPCCHRDFITLQARVAAVRIAEEGV